MPWQVIQFFSEIQRNREVFVLASGPSASTAKLRDDHALVCVNGSMGVPGCRNPEILLINEPTLTEMEGVAKTSRESFRGRHSSLLVCITKALSFPSMLDRLNALGLRWENAVELCGDARRKVTGLIVDREIPLSPGNALAASAGVTAAALSHLAGGGGSCVALIFRGGISIRKELEEVIRWSIWKSWKNLLNKVAGFMKGLCMTQLPREFSFNEPPRQRRLFHD